jgi:hypothetical protein
MRANGLWSAVARRFSGKLGAHVRTECSVTGEHQGPLIAVAGRGGDATLMCQRHAVAWAESDLCRDVAAHNSKASLGALSLWIAAEAAEG